MMCRVLQVSRSRYYQWVKFPISKRELKCKALHERIRTAYDLAQGCYGSPRLTKELQQSGFSASNKTVAKHMKVMGLRSKLSRKYRSTSDSSHKEPVAENVLNREFFSFSQGEKCVSAITDFPTLI